MKRNTLKGRAACVIALIAAMFAGLLNSAVLAQTQPGANGTPAPAPAAKARATASRGVAGEFIFEFAGPVLRAKPNQALTSPMLVRLTLLSADKPLERGEARKYKLSFIGAVAGTFDLRDFVERADGQALTDLPELTVNVVSQLPDKHGTDLFTAKHPTFLLESHYRTLMYVFIGAWVAIPALVLIRRAIRKRGETPPPPAPPPPTLAEQLRPLVEAAANRGLSVAEQGRLELLLISFWRERLGLGSLSPAQAIGRIRADATAGNLLVAVERWLHSRGSTAPSARPTEDIAALLEPYRTMPAVVLGTSVPTIEEVAS